MFSCGWLPPVGNTQAGFMAESGVELYWLPGSVAQRFPAALGDDGVVVEPTGT